MIVGTHVGKVGGGRLGNSLWQWSFLESLRLKHGIEYAIPTWHYSKFFMSPPPQIDNTPLLVKQIEEPHFHYTPEYWESLIDDFKTQTVGLRGWFQSSKYLEEHSSQIKERLSFTHEFQNSLKEKFKHIFTKPTIAISIRRGDYVGNSNYHLLSIEYYIGALYYNFSNFKDYNIVIFSDDLAYCRTHFECLDNSFFAEGLSDIEQLCLGTMMDNFIVSNSTFAFWMAYLGKKSYSKIVRPNYHFAGKLLEESDWSTYYPNDWIIYDHNDVELNRIDLHDVTFCIPVFYDHPDRNSNLLLNICMLQRLFNADILVGEMGGEQWKDIQGINYVNFPEIKNFHRTKMLNEMFYSVQTNIIFNWDADVVVPPLQVLKCIEELRSKRADMCYPYDGRFARVPRNRFSTIESFLDIGILGGEVFKGMRQGDGMSVGGAMAWRKDVFIEGGGENENMISYAPEDTERRERFERLGYKVGRVKGVLYHLDHFISIDSSEKNPFFNDNWNELYKIRNMSNKELKEYVKSWVWMKK